MSLDIRVPIGLLFLVLGALLAIYGLATRLGSPAMYERSLGININLWWGLAMAIFGAAMTYFGWRGRVSRPTSTA